MKWIVLGVAVFLVVIYTCLWFVLSGLLQNYVTTRIQSSKTRGITAHCDNIHKTGYPLRVAVACDTLIWSRPTAGLSFATSRFVAGAPVYAPHWRSFFIDAPSTFEFPGLRPMRGKWKNLEINADFQDMQVTEFTLATNYISLSNINETDTEDQTLQAEFIRFDAKSLREEQKKDSDLNMRVSFDKLLLPKIRIAKQQTLPAVDGSLELTILDADDLFLPLNGPLSTRLRNHGGQINKMVIVFETGGKLTATGWFRFSESGKLTGRFDVAISEAGALKQTMRQVFSSQANNMEALFFALNAMPKNKKGEPVITFNVENGKIRSGFIKLGKIPAL